MTTKSFPAFHRMSLMKKLSFCSLFLCCLLCVQPSIVRSQEKGEKSAQEKSAEAKSATTESIEQNSDDQKATEAEVLAGHSYHGEAFNEGPRQKAYLMGTTSNIHFPISTKNDLVQKFFDQGVGQLHGFWYLEAERSFRQAAMIEPECAMSYWGMAMANASGRQNSKRAKEFIKKAVQYKENASEREGMYIDSLSESLNSSKNRKDKSLAILEAHDAILAKYPDDIEAKAFKVLAMYHYRKSKGQYGRPNAEKLLKEIFAENPMHPCHHYRIHLWDYPKPSNAVVSSSLCGSSAPGIAHMWHMSGHIYSRLKRYNDAVWQQEASARVDHAHMMRDRVMPDQIHNFAHNNEWLIRNLIFVGRFHDGMDLAKNMIELPRHPKYNHISRSGSYRYGRMRLQGVLTQYELWPQLLELSETPYLSPTDNKNEQIKRLRMIGQAHFGLNDVASGKLILADLEQQLKEIEKKKKEFDAKAKAKKSTKKNTKKSSKARGRKRGRRRRRNTRNPFSSQLRELKKAVKSLKARVLIANGDYQKGLKELKASSGVNKMDLVRAMMQAGKLEDAVKECKRYLRNHKNETIPLAHYVQALWNADKKDEAKKQFELLRKVAGAADLDAPVLVRLESIAKELGYKKDWRHHYQFPKDFGKRPAIESLGPFRWSASPAPQFALKDVHNQVHSLKDYRGKNVVVIFYLGYGCLHCAEQLQAFAPKAQQFADAGIELIAISTDDMAGLEKSHENYEDGEFPFPLVTDSKLEVFKKFRAHDDFEKLALHGTFLIDGEGKVLWQDIGYEPFMDPDFVIKEAKKLLGQSAYKKSLASKASTN